MAQATAPILLDGVDTNAAADNGRRSAQEARADLAMQRDRYRMSSDTARRDIAIDLPGDANA